MGPADGLNKGFSVATGDVFAFINADDMLLRGAVSQAVAELEKDPLCGVVAGRGYVANRDGFVVREIRPSKISPRGLALGAVTVFQQGWFIRRPVYEAVGGFNTANRHSWDYELLLEISLRGALVTLCDFYSGIWMLRPDSILHTAHETDPAEYLATRQRLVKRVLGRPRSPVDTPERTARRIAKWLASPDAFLVRTGIRGGQVGRRVVVAADGSVTVAVSR
jgi:glycosyltransferase involved in cell wall biosynthesis